MSDSTALRELYAASHGRLVAVVAAYCGSVTEAEDCVQDAFAKALPRWDSLVRYDDPEGWIRHVALNASRSRFRRQLRFDGLRSRLASTDTSPDVSPDHVALMTALRRLPADQRKAIVLHHLVDLPVEAIAAREGLPVGTVKARLSRGRKALADHLGGPPGPDGRPAPAALNTDLTDSRSVS